jgi:hypothetical protein
MQDFPNPQYQKLKFLRVDILYSLKGVFFLIKQVLLNKNWKKMLPLVHGYIVLPTSNIYSFSNRAELIRNDLPVLYLPITHTIPRCIF